MSASTISQTTINKYVISFHRSDGSYESFISKAASIADTFNLLEIGMKDKDFTMLTIALIGSLPAVPSTQNTQNFY
jgi:hypothetical protein